MIARTGLLSLGVALLFFVGACEKAGRSGDVHGSIKEGWREYSFGTFDRAIAIFETVAKHAPEKSAEQLEALYGLATVWDLRRPGEDGVRAAGLYRQVIAKDPKGEFAAWSALALARLQYLVPVGQQPNFNAVRAAYQQVIDRYPDQLAADEAFIFQQTTLVQTFDPSEARLALAALENFIITHPRSPYLATVHSLLADCYRVLGDQEKRLEEEIASLETREKDAKAIWQKHPVGVFRFDAANAAGEVFKIAHIAEFEAGDFETARKYYRRFLRENPTEKRVFYSRQALERMDRAEAQLRARQAGQGHS